MTSSDVTSIPEGYKRCSKGDKCVHPNGPILPKTVEYFRWRKNHKVWGFSCSCRECEKAYDTAYRQTPERKAYFKSEKVKAQQKKYYQSAERQAALKAYHQTPEWKQKHKHYIQTSEKYQDYQHAYRNSPKRKAMMKEYRLQRPELKERDRNYRKTPQGKASRHAAQERRRARELSVLATFTVLDWQFCLEYFDYRCVACGRPAGLWHKISQDHWVPVTKGGGYTPDNIVPLCHSLKDGELGCNNQKSNRDAHEWLVERFGKRKAAIIEKRVQEYFDAVRGQK